MFKKIAEIVGLIVAGMICLVGYGLALANLVDKVNDFYD